LNLQNRGPPLTLHPVVVGQSLVGKTFYEAHSLREQGISARAIARTLRVSRKAVRTALERTAAPILEGSRRQGGFTSIPVVISLAVLAFVLVANDAGNPLTHQIVLTEVRAPPTVRLGSSLF
jgi:hypothetical protein